MPIVLDPQSPPWPTWLESDAEKPPDARPTFYFRHLSARQWKRLNAVQDRIAAAESGPAALDVVLDAINDHLETWTHMTNASEWPLEVATGPVGPGADVPFDPRNLEAIVGLPEANELLRKLIRQHPEPDEDDAKKSPSPSPASTANSAKTAEARPAAAAEPTPTSKPDAENTADRPPSSPPTSPARDAAEPATPENVKPATEPEPGN